MAPETDFELRQAAIARVQELSDRYDDILPVDALREGFTFRGERVSFGSFYSGIFRPRQLGGPAALSLTTTPPKAARGAPYDDGYDEASGTFVYHYRSPQRNTAQALRAAEADNEALRACAAHAVPVIYFHGIGPSQYTAVAPAFVVRDDSDRRLVELQAAPALTSVASGPGSEPVRRYATRQAVVRLHQHRFRTLILRAYGGKCAVCALREAQLLQAAHIIEDHDPGGAPAIVNGIALCAIHHAAYDRNLMGIDPAGGVHISERLLREHDGPMLSTGLQGFHGAAILQPRLAAERPDPDRLEIRFEHFRDVA